MTNQEIKDFLENIPFDQQNARWYSLSEMYSLKYNDTPFPYWALYLMDNKLGNYTQKENIKYAMFVYDESTKSEDVLYIVIGQNPSQSHASNVDSTNQNIYKAMLGNNHTRYLLLNTFPIIDADGANSPDLLKTKENIEIAQQIIECLSQKLKIKIVYACGSSLPVFAKFLDKIDGLVKKHNLKSYAFEGDNQIRTHLAMQALNSKPIRAESLKLVECYLEIEEPTDFKKAIFKRGSRNA